MTHPTFNTQDKAVIEVLGKGADPLAPSPPTPGGLALGEHQERRRLPTLNQAESLRISRVYRVVDQHTPGANSCLPANLSGTEGRYRRRQLIAAPPDLMDREAQLGFHLLQLLPYGTTTDTQRIAQGLPLEEMMVQSEKMLSVGGLAA